MVLILLSDTIQAQQPAPIELLAEPEKYSFALSGILMGNIDEEELNVNTKKTQTSGKIFLDAYITPRLFTSIHINAVKKSFATQPDSFDVAALSFTHNDYKFNFSTAYKYEDKVAKYHLFFDYSISQQDLLKRTIYTMEQISLNTFKVNLGLQAFWEADWDQHLIVSISLKFNKMWIEDNPNDPKALEKAFNLPPEDKFLRKYNGFSLKATIQLNTISIFCETQNNYTGYTAGKEMPIPGFTRHTYYSIGFVTTSTAILGKRKVEEAPKRISAPPADISAINF